MKHLILALLFFALTTFSSRANLIQFSSDEIEAKWNKAPSEILKQIESKILEEGLSSTGIITVTGTYILTHDEAIGKKGEAIALVRQEDLHGSRLFSLHLVNLDSGKIIKIYRT
jgi:hypothetical protein